ncbi:hypothetical protein VitviT2T_027377 [Vitis vinifera]|uniref:inorganic diphosphatase n=1 Tax=Vitis vinifera TaxID=29760 RepID=A0ABY9DQR5_VITVI|nr:hypothetical protein VitviT2T_027377 [Vitis vinifera]
MYKRQTIKVLLLDCGIATGGSTQIFQNGCCCESDGVAGALYHANTRTSSFLLKPFSITHKAIRLNRNLNAAPRRLFACRAQTQGGKLRFYPYDINWNYGLLAQTWEDPSFANSEVGGAFGDNDPVDVVEIGERRGKTGGILKVKPLAALAMIDEGELEWKIVAISLDDPRASLLNDVDDVEKHFPGTLTAIRDWFRDYKIPDGKPPNKFGLGNKAANKDYALKEVLQLEIFRWCNLHS